MRPEAEGARQSKGTSLEWILLGNEGKTRAYRKEYSRSAYLKPLRNVGGGEALRPSVPRPRTPTCTSEMYVYSFFSSLEGLNIYKSAASRKQPSARVHLSRPRSF